MYQSKTMEITFWQKAAGILVGLAIAGVMASYPSFASAVDQLPIPIASAHSAEDHEKLAAYFDSQADGARERLKQHEELRESYKASLGSLGSFPIATVRDLRLPIVRHCELLVENARRDVESYEAIAQQHRAHASMLKE